MMPTNFYALVKEEPETISENEMETTNVVLPPTSCGMSGHTPPGGVAPPHVVGAPMPPGLPLTPVTPTSMQPQQLRRLDIDPNFEPVVRSRSNTWPLPCPEGYIEGEEPSVVPTGDMPTPIDPARPPGTPGQPGDPTVGAPKKNTSRRNPWGNMSYADLIAQAILSSPDARSTLSQIYDWMVQNVPYFKDKGDSNSSAGWKNSIRHNLSLHNRFMRVQNEGTGKSSWWVLNPDAKPGKSTRRRANTNPMEGGRFEKKRGRVKKKMEAIRNGLDLTPSPSSSISENLDLYPDSPLTHPHPAFSQLSPQDFRPRASSNASSCGRLSPIPAIESDMHDAQVPPMSPGIGGWGPGDYWGHHGPHHGHHLDRYTDQLVDSIGEGLKLGTADWATRHAHPNPSDCMKLTQLSPHAPHHPPPPPPLMNGYHPHHQQHHPQAYGSFEDFHRFGPHNPHHPNYSLPPTHQDKLHTPTRPPHPHSSYTLTNLQVRPQAMSPAHSAHSLSPTQPLGEGHYPGPGGEAHQPTSSFPSPPSSQPSPGHSQVPTSEASNMLRQALQHRDQQQQQQQQQRDGQHRDQQQREAQQQENQQQQQQQQHREQQQQQQPPQRSQTGQREGSTGSGGSQREGGSGSSGSSSGTGPGGQPMQDFVDLDTIQGGLECNVEEVIKHELQMGGSLDFSFPQAHHAHHAHAHHHAHHQHMADHSPRPQMPGPPAMPPYNCNSIAAGNHWVR